MKDHSDRKTEETAALLRSWGIMFMGLKAEKEERLLVFPVLHSEESHMYHPAAKKHSKLKFPLPAHLQTHT